MPRRNKSSKQDDNKKLIPLRRLAQESSYSPAYVSILVQRKKLKAEKVGRNYFSTREWFNQYLEDHARDEKRQQTIVKQEKIKKKDPLKKIIKKEPEKAAKKITEEIKKPVILINHLEKVLTKKIIKYPLVTSDSLLFKLNIKWKDNYNDVVNEIHQQSKKERIKKDFSLQKYITIISLSIQKIRRLWLQIYNLKNKLTQFSNEVSFFIAQKSYQAKLEAINKLTPRPWAVKYLIISFLILFIIIPIGASYPKTISKLTNSINTIYNITIIHTTSYVKNNLLNLKNQIIKINNNKNIVINFNQKEKQGRVAGISEKAKTYTDKIILPQMLLAKSNNLKNNSKEIINSIIDNSGDVINSTANKQIKLSQNIEKKFIEYDSNLENNKTYQSFALLISNTNKEQIKKLVTAKFYQDKIKNYNLLFWQNTNQITNYLNNGFKKGHLAILKLFKTDEIDGIKKARVAGEQEAGEGVVVVPFKDEYEAQEIKDKINDLFSDDVEVDVDETKRAGIIKPVFGTEVDEQEYLYMMVPVNEEN